MTARMMPLRRRSEARTLAEHVAGELRAEMGRQGISQSEIGRALGLDSATISKRLATNQHMNLDFIEAICALLGIEPEVLFRWIPPDEPVVNEPVRRQGLEPRTRWLKAA